MSELLYGPTLWARIRAQAAAVTSRRAAVAYVGSHADELIEFGIGDTLVFDGSSNALRSGVTNPSTIRTWLDRGADMYSYEGLHAKVLVLGRTVFVGSPNLSWHSHDHLLEAAVVDTSTNLRRSATKMLDELQASSLEPIGQLWLADADKLYRPPRGPQAGAHKGNAGQPLLPPTKNFRFLFGSVKGQSTFNAKEVRADNEAQDLLRGLRGPVRVFNLIPWVMSPTENDVRAGDVWILVDSDQFPAVSAPARVLRVVDLSSKTRVAYLRNDLTKQPMDLDLVRDVVRRAGGRWIYDRNITSSSVRAAILRIWGLHE